MVHESRPKGHKMTPFDEKDDMGSYLHRFERYAEIQRWKRMIGLCTCPHY